MAKNSKGQTAVHVIVFLTRVLSISAIIFSLPFLFLFYSESNFNCFLTIFIIACLLLICCHPVWKIMKDKTNLDPKREIELLLDSSNTPLEVRSAIHAFQNGIATLDDATAVAPYGIYYPEIYRMLKRQNFSFVHKETKRFFMRNCQKEFLESLKAVRANQLSDEDAIVAWSYELLTTEETKKLLQNYPETIRILSSPEFVEDRPTDSIIRIFRKEKRNQILK